MAFSGRIGLPAGGRGYWPAFWMLGAPFRSDIDAWPSAGELDAMENVNNERTVSGSLHCGRVERGGPCDEPDGVTAAHDLGRPAGAAGFHTYTVVWNTGPRQLRWYVDDRLYLTVPAERIGTRTWESTFGHGFFIILNVAIDGDWPGAPGAGQFAGDAKWSQGPFDVVGGHYYSFSDWYESSGNTEFVVWVRTAGGAETYYNLDIGVPASATWRRYHTGFQMPGDAVQAQFLHVLDDNGHLLIDDASMVDRGDAAGFARAIVTITQDAGTREVLSAAIPALDARGFKSTQFVVTGVLNQPGEWTSQNLRDLVADGHEIGSHSVTHPDLVTGTDINGDPGTITPTQRLAELRDSQAALQSILGVPVPDFAYPFGSHNDEVTPVAGTFYRASRGVETGYHSRFDLADSLQAIRVHNITSPTSQQGVPAMSMADFRGWVDFAVAHRLWLVLVYHNVTATPGPFDTTPALFGQQLDYLMSKGVSVQTMQSALDELLPQTADGPPPPPSPAPDTAITSGPPASTSSRTATFGFASDTLGSTFECKLDAASFATCTSPKTYSSLALGPHTFQVRATTAGLTDPTPASLTWTVTAPADTTPPTITITRPVNGRTYLVGQTVTVSYSCADASGIASCVGTLPDGAFLPTATQNTAATFRADATDNAGNTSSKTVTYRVCDKRNCR